MEYAGQNKFYYFTRTTLAAIFYVGFAIYAMIAVARGQEGQIVMLRPTIAQFRNVVHLSGRLGGDFKHRGGVTPLLAGRQLTCGVSYLGASTNCRELLPSLVTGTSLTADVASITCFSGTYWVALSITLEDGSSYTTTPELMMRKWALDSHALIPRITWDLGALFFGLPLIFALIFKFASWLPQRQEVGPAGETRGRKRRVIDGTKPWG